MSSRGAGGNAAPPRCCCHGSNGPGSGADFDTCGCHLCKPKSAIISRMALRASSSRISPPVLPPCTPCKTFLVPKSAFVDPNSFQQTGWATLSPQPSTLNPQPSTLNPQPSTLNPQPSTLNHVAESPRRGDRWVE